MQTKIVELGQQKLTEEEIEEIKELVEDLIAKHYIGAIYTDLANVILNEYANLYEKTPDNKFLIIEFSSEKCKLQAQSKINMLWNSDGLEHMAKTGECNIFDVKWAAYYKSSNYIKDSRFLKYINNCEEVPSLMNVEKTKLEDWRSIVEPFPRNKTLKLAEDSNRIVDEDFMSAMRKEKIKGMKGFITGRLF